MFRTTFNAVGICRPADAGWREAAPSLLVEGWIVIGRDCLWRIIVKLSV
jgi:hypothetical protein